MAAVIVCSDSIAAGQAHDRSGALAAQLLGAAGWQVGQPVVVPDDVAAISVAITSARDAGAAVIVTSGGTGLGPRDVTVAAVEALGASLIPGVGEAIRAAARDRVPTADLSRGGAYLLGASLLLCLPGSVGGVRDGMQIALPLLPHALAMLAGGGHAGGHAGPPAVAPADAVAASTELVADAPIDVGELAALVERAEGGAVVSFNGVVRDHDHGRSVNSLAYQAHPDAGRILAELLIEARARPGVLAAEARHRTGELDIGDVAFAVAVTAAHRGEAFAACSWLVDEGKRRLPIWKLQRFADGTQEWVNCP